MKIAFISDAYIPVPTGTAVSIETLRVSLEKMGHTVYIFTPKEKGFKGKERRVARLPAIFSPYEKYSPLIWPVGSVDKELIERLNLDIVHSHYFFKSFDFAKKMADFAQVPLVNTFYRMIPEHDRNIGSKISLSNKYLASLEKVVRYANICDQLVALSETSREYYVESNVQTPIEVIPVGIFPRDFASYPPEAVKDRFNIPQERKVLLYVARLEYDSNIQFLLKAFKNIWKAIDDVHLLIVGGGSQEKEFKKLVSHQSFSKFVTFSGYLPKNQANKIYGACDIFVYPKTSDPQPLAVLESLAAGTPVVSVRGFGAQEFITNNVDGFITKPSVEEFSEKVIDLLRRNNMRVQFSLNARTNSRNFRASNLTADLVELYDLVIEGKNNKKELF